MRSLETTGTLTSELCSLGSHCVRASPDPPRLCLPTVPWWALGSFPAWLIVDVRGQSPTPPRFVLPGGWAGGLLGLVTTLSQGASADRGFFAGSSWGPTNTCSSSLPRRPSVWPLRGRVLGKQGDRSPGRATQGAGGLGRALRMRQSGWTAEGAWSAEGPLWAARRGSDSGKVAPSLGGVSEGLEEGRAGAGATRGGEQATWGGSIRLPYGQQKAGVQF